MKTALYVFIWALGTAALPVVLTPPRADMAPVEAVPATPAALELALSATEPNDEPAASPTPTPEAIADVVARSRRIALVAHREAADYAALDRDEGVLDSAAAHLRRTPARTLDLVDRTLEVSHDEAISARAWWLRGEALTALGDYAEALASYDQVQAGPVPDHLALRQARLRHELGESSQAADLALDLVDRLAGTGFETLHEARELRLQSLFAAGRYAELVEEADDFLARYREYPRQDQLWYQIGQAHIALDEPRLAATYFDRIVWDYPYRPVAHAALMALRTLAAADVEVPQHSFNERFERAQRHRVNKHWDIVDGLLEDLLRDVLREQGENGFANEIRRARWRNAHGSGDFAAALGHLEAIREAGRRGIRRSDLNTLFSETHARLGQIEQGVEAIRRRDQDRSPVRRHNSLAEYYFENGQYTEALQHYREVLSARSQAGWSFSLLLFMGGEYRQAGRNFEALADHAVGVDFRRYTYWEGRAYQEIGYEGSARRRFEEVIERRAGSYYGLQARNRLLEMDRSRPASMQVGVEPADAVAAPTAPPPSLEQLAGAMLRGSNLYLTELVRRRADDPAPLVGENSDDGVRFERPARLHWDGPDGVADAHLALLVTDHDLQSAYYVPPESDALSRLADEYGDLFPRMERADFLYSVGRRHEARVEARDASIEFRALSSAFSRRRPRRQRPISLRQRRFAHYIDNRSIDTGFWGVRLNNYRYPIQPSGDERTAQGERQVAIYDNRIELREAFRQGLMALGDYHLVRRFARERRGWSSRPAEGEGRQDWSEAYPRAYPELVTEFSAEYDQNPYVMWALMTVESSHNPDSISRANARGLLQVIPKTGQLISQRLGYWDFGPHNLMTPALSIEFGCYYFSELMTKFRGQEMLAFAGYNGGPHNVARWLEGRGDLPLDAFIESIPFDQARRYSMRVYRYLAIYRRIYFGEDHLFLGQIIDPEYEANIHF